MDLEHGWESDQRFIREELLEEGVVLSFSRNEQGPFDPITGRYAPILTPGLAPGLEPGREPGREPGLEPGREPGREPTRESGREPGRARHFTAPALMRMGAPGGSVAQAWRDQGLVLTGDEILLVAAGDYEPALEDRVAVGGERWTVKAVTTARPGLVPLMHYLLIRRV